MKKKILNLLSLLCNAATVILVAYSVLCFYFGGGVGNMTGAGAHIFVYYTTDSNILAALLCLPMLACNIRALCGHDEVPLWVNICKWVGTVCIMLTFMVVMCFLGVLMGYRAMLSGVNLFLHLICPLLCLVSFLFFERGTLPKRELCWTLLPTVIYGIFYFVQVVVIGAENGGWPDFYLFNRAGHWYLTVLLIMGCVLLMAIVFRRVRRSIEKK